VRRLVRSPIPVSYAGSRGFVGCVCSARGSTRGLRRDRVTIVDVPHDGAAPDALALAERRAAPGARAHDRAGAFAYDKTDEAHRCPCEWPRFPRRLHVVRRRAVSPLGARQDFFCKTIEGGPAQVGHAAEPSLRTIQSWRRSRSMAVARGPSCVSETIPQPSQTASKSSRSGIWVSCPITTRARFGIPNEHARAAVGAHHGRLRRADRSPRSG
jgi:hypothetical protein